MEANAGVMIRRPAFWLFFFWAVFLCTAALAMISQASGFASALAPERAAGTIATAVGMISVFNGVGRVLFGSLFDRKGRKVTMLCINGAFFLAVAVLAAAWFTKSFALMILGFACLGIAYGGCPTMSSAFIGAFYGMEHYPVNFSILNMNLLVASFGGTIAGALYDMSGSYVTVLLLMLGSVAVGAILSLGIRRP